MSEKILNSSYETFFNNLVHPAFIALIDKNDGSTKISDYTVNNVIQDVFNGDLSDKQNKIKSLEDILYRIFPNNEKLRIEYIEAAEYINQNTSNIVEIEDEDIPVFETIEIIILKEDDDESRFVIQSKKLEGIKSILSIDGEENFHDLFSILHKVTDKDIQKGFQAVFPMVNKRREEFLRFKIQAVRSALSRVMTRNMSHNIGSHVLSRMVDPVNIDEDEIISDSKLHYKSIFESEYGYYKKNEIAQNSSKDFYNGLLSTFFSYLKSRQDFLADVVSGTPKVQTTKNLIYDIFNGLDKNRLLLNRISGLENFNYGFSFEGDLIQKESIQNNLIKYRDIEVAVSNDIMGQHAFFIIIENIIRNTAKHGTKLSNENFHEIKISVKESKSNSSLYQITIYDNVELEGYCVIAVNRNLNLYDDTIIYNDNLIIDSSLKNKSIEINLEDQIYYIKSLSNIENYKHLGYSQIIDENNKILIIDYFEISRIDQLVVSQNVWINKPVLNQESFDLRLHALGLIEMETCAAYLRRIPIEQTESPEFRLKFSKKEKIQFLDKEVPHGAPLRILRAVRPISQDGVLKKCLGYRFYLPKPKDLLIIDSDGKLWDECNKKSKGNYSEFKDLERLGILLLDARSHVKGNTASEYTFDSSAVYQHEMLLTIGQINDKINTHLPKRKISLTSLIENYNSFHEKEIDINENKILMDIFIEKGKRLKLEVLRAIVRNKFSIDKNLCLIRNNKAQFGVYLSLPETNREIYRLTFLHHGKNLGNSKVGNYREIYASQHERLIETIENSVSPSKSDRMTKLKFLDSTVTNVLVLDERIQELAQSYYHLENGDKIRYRDAWDLVNVYIPKVEEEINLSSNIFVNDFGKKIRKIIENQFVKGNTERVSTGLDYLVIHLGIIERALNVLEMDKNDNKDREWLLQELTKGITTSKPHVVIVSGRAPRELPQNTSYLSFSTLSQYMIENRFKYNLVEVLNTSRNGQ
jgi:hypothetical protein